MTFHATWSRTHCPFLFVTWNSAHLGKMFHRIMIHSKNYLSALVGRKCIIFSLKIEPYWELNLHFWKLHCNTPMYCKMHFTDISQGMIWPNMLYYTKLKLSRIYNPFSQTTYDEVKAWPLNWKWHKTFWRQNSPVDNKRCYKK